VGVFPRLFYGFVYFLGILFFVFLSSFSFFLSFFPPGIGALPCEMMVCVNIEQHALAREMLLGCRAYSFRNLSPCGPLPPLGLSFGLQVVEENANANFVSVVAPQRRRNWCLPLGQAS